MHIKRGVISVEGKLKEIKLGKIVKITTIVSSTIIGPAGYFRHIYLCRKDGSLITKTLILERDYQEMEKEEKD